jgi:hypothetical protein
MMRTTEVGGYLNEGGSRLALTSFENANPSGGRPSMLLQGSLLLGCRLRQLAPRTVVFRHKSGVNVLS